MKQGNSSFSFDERNQFMQNASQSQPMSQQQVSEMFNFMKKLYENQSLMESMQKHIIKNNSSINISEQSSVSKQENQRVQPQRKKGTDVLKSQNEKQLSKFLPKNFDDQPIKPMAPEKYQNIENNQNNKQIKQNQNKKLYNEIEQRPLNGIKQMIIEPPKQKSPPQKVIDFSEFEQRPIVAKGAYIIPENQIKITPKSNHIDERPINGSSNNIFQSNLQSQSFKNKLKDAFPANYLPGDDENSTFNDQIGKKTVPKSFLKKGSRQTVSSTKIKSQKSIKEQVNDKSLLQENKSMRSTSQNRILGKRNSNKSVNKNLTKTQNIADRSYIQEEEKINNKSKVKPRALPPKIETSHIPKYNTSTSPTPNKKKKNIFVENDESSSDSESEQTNFREPQRQKFKNSPIKPRQEEEIEVIRGIFMTKDQLQQIVIRYGQKPKHKKEQDHDKMAELRKKYTDLCSILENQREELKENLQNKKQEFQAFKTNEINKLKNQRKVMERNVKSNLQTQTLNKEKEELETMKRQIEKQREQFKKKDKNNRIIIEKYKKQNDQLKVRLERMDFTELQNKKTKQSYSSLYTKNQTEEEIENKSLLNKNKANSKPEQQVNNQKKQKPSIKQGKQKYQFVEEEIIQKKGMNEKKSNHNAWQIQDNSESEHQEEQKSQNSDIQQEVEDQIEWTPAMKLPDLVKIPLSIKMVCDKMIESLFRSQNNIEFRKYIQMTTASSRQVVSSNRSALQNKVIKVYNDHSKEILFDNGTKKATLESGYTIIYFKNGDIKQKLSDGTILYYFKEKEVDQITLTNGVNIFRFDNNQVEFHFDGDKYIEIRHPDGTIKVLGKLNKI